MRAVLHVKPSPVRGDLVVPSRHRGLEGVRGMLCSGGRERPAVLRDALHARQEWGALSVFPGCRETCRVGRRAVIGAVHGDVFVSPTGGDHPAGEERLPRSPRRKG